MTNLSAVEFGASVRAMVSRLNRGDYLLDLSLEAQERAAVSDAFIQTRGYRQTKNRYGDRNPITDIRGNIVRADALTQSSTFDYFRAGFNGEPLDRRRQQRQARRGRFSGSAWNEKVRAYNSGVSAKRRGLPLPLDVVPY